MSMIELKKDIIFDNHYTLIRQLGRGGFSEVWLAHDSYMDLDVAIKIYAPGQGMDSNSINIFRHEIKDIFHLNHPNLLTPKHLGVFENMPYLVMPYCSAGSCCNMIRKMPEAEIWHLIYDVASGLTYLHDKDIVHQDIKPDNILINAEGNYLITDFGISTRARSTLIKSSIVSLTTAGTIAYMGPERFTTQPAPTKASDIWSFGAMLFELLEGTTPFPPGLGGSMQNKDAAIPTIKVPVSDKLKQTIYKMLSKETWDRPTAATLIEWANNQLLEKNGTIKIPQTPKKKIKPIRKWLLFLFGILFIIGLSILCVCQYRIYKEAEQRRIKKENYNIYLNNKVCNSVDLGLSVKWATCNIGAIKPKECGYKFAWGEIQSKSVSWESTYKHCVDKFYDNLTKYCTDSNYGNNGFIDNKTELDPEDDAAAVIWGGSWRIPTLAELEELRFRCKWVWTTQYGTGGYKVIGPNGNSIFLPIEGEILLGRMRCYSYYWSSSLDTNDPSKAYSLYLGEGGDGSWVKVGSEGRVNVYVVRPVCP